MASATLCFAIKQLQAFFFRLSKCGAITSKKSIKRAVQCTPFGIDEICQCIGNMPYI
jgi:hypothetical protein